MRIALVPPLPCLFWRPEASPATPRGFCTLKETQVNFCYGGWCDGVTAEQTGLFVQLASGRGKGPLCPLLVRVDPLPSVWKEVQQWLQLFRGFVLAIRIAFGKDRLDNGFMELFGLIELRRHKHEGGQFVSGSIWKHCGSWCWCGVTESSTTSSMSHVGS